MYRKAMEDLLEWQVSDERKPMVLKELGRLAKPGL